MKYTVSPEQQRATDMLYANGFRGIAWWKAGEGKTRLALHAWWGIRSEARVCLVITRRVAFDDWRAEAQEKMGLSCMVAEVKEFGKLQTLKIKRPILLLVSHGSLHKLREMSPPLPLDEMVAIVDELYLFANASAKRSIDAYWVTQRTQGVVGLSATIMPAKNNLAIWGQTKVVGIHWSLAKNKTKFITEYQTKLEAQWIKTGFRMVNKAGSDRRINRILKNYVDLNYPDNQHRKIHENILAVSPTRVQAAAFMELKDSFEYRDREFQDSLSVLHALCGVSNGWFVDSNGSLFDVPSTKLERLAAIVDELTSAGERVVIWCAYRNDVDRVRRYLSCPTIPFISGVPFDTVRWKSGKVDVVVATESIGASVNHFEKVGYAIYFSLNFKWVDLQQSMGRHDRKSSEHDACFYYYLQTRGSMDAHIYTTVRQSRGSEISIIKTLTKTLEHNKQTQ